MSSQINGPNYLPPELQRLFHPQFPETTETVLKDEATRAALQVFAAAHSSLWVKSSLLKDLTARAREIDFDVAADEDSTLFAFKGIHKVVSTAHRWLFSTAPSTVELERMILNEPNKIKSYCNLIPVSNRSVCFGKIFDVLIDYKKMGLIDKNRIINILHEIKEFSPFLRIDADERIMDSELFVKAIPLLQDLDTETLVSILSILDKDGNSLLHYSDVFKDAIPLLQKLSKDKFVAVLSIVDKSGNSPLLCWSRFENAIPSLHSLDQDKLVAVLSILDKDGHSPLLDSGMLKDAIPLLQKLDKDKLVTVLSILDKSGNSPLHYSRMFKDAIPFLQSLDQDKLVAVLSILNKDGNSPLHYSRMFKGAISFCRRRFYREKLMRNSDFSKDAIFLLQKLHRQTCHCLINLK